MGCCCCCFLREKKIQIASDKEALKEEEDALRARFFCLFGHWPVSSCSVSELHTAVVSCCYCVHSPTLFPRSCLYALQKPETRKLCQLLAKPWRPQNVDKEIDSATVDHTQSQIDDVRWEKDIRVATVDEEFVHDALRDAQGDDGWRGQDEDGGHDHQHPGQGHLT